MWPRMEESAGHDRAVGVAVQRPEEALDGVWRQAL